MNYEYEMSPSTTSVEYDSSYMSPNYAESRPMSSGETAFLLGFGVVILVIALAAYIYSSLASYTIAKKTQTENPWMAWVPILNIWLYVKMARRDIIWFILGLLPFANIISLVVCWMDIAKRRNRPDWWGVLMLIPLVNFVILGLLAWTEAKPETAK